ncbi:MAG: hypothetical protein JXB88_17405 [Spirochaetales bacterium]|nr:hypothetical protein [Spirochaetales bacterium]
MKLYHFLKIIILIISFFIITCVSTEVLDNNSALEKLSEEIVQSMVKGKQVALAVSDFPDRI